MHVLVATDAWHPQVNGVVRSIEETARAATAYGVRISVLTPEQFRTVPMPFYKEIRLALAGPRGVARAIAQAKPDTVHIATEGPIGWLVRRWCLANGMAFTTSYHTKFPEYVAARLPIPESLVYALMRRFHAAATTTLVATQTLRRELEAHGFDNLGLWGRGVDTRLFDPQKRVDLGLPGPIFLHVGRLAVEKNVEAFLQLALPGTKLVVGDGPARAMLEARYPQAVFVGAKRGEDLASYFASADAFVFPSLTDTFGLVQLEALASGLPVAAFPVAGPLDVVGECKAAILREDLREAALQALDCSREEARAFALTRSWDACAFEFVAHVARAAGVAVPDRIMEPAPA